MNRLKSLAYITLALCSIWLRPTLAQGKGGEPESWLRGISERLHQAKTKDLEPVRILHVGDSHVKGDAFTAPIGIKLTQSYGERCTYQSIGINGSTYQTWLAENNLKRIVDIKPDLLIISLGTNDSYSTRFSPEVMRSNMLAFHTELRKHLPKLSIIYTTPPANYLRQSKRVVRGTIKRKNGKRRTLYRYTTTHTFNEQTERARQLIREVAEQQGTPCIDLNSYIGSKTEAIDWLKQGLMHQDHVHYTPAGYNKQGQWVADELLKILTLPNTGAEVND